MQLIAQYPIQEAQLMPHIGRCVAACTHEGDTFCGIIDRMEGGNIYFRPLGAGGAAVQSIQQNPQVKKMMDLAKNSSLGKATTSAWGPWGWGGWWWPLWGLTALWLLPFFW